MIYEKFLKTLEVRTVIFYNAIFGVIGAVISYAFAMRWNLQVGISDYFLLMFTDVVFNSI